MKYWAFAVLAACGGAEGTPLLEGGAGDPTSGDAPSNDVQAGDVQSGNDGGSCQALLADLELKRQAAIQCCQTCGTLQCTQQIEGLCCAVTVTSGDSLASKAYEGALDAVKNAKCIVDCPPNTCSSNPTNDCQQTGSCMQ